MMINEQLTITATTAISLDKKVNEKASEGWVATGGINIDEGVLYQQMYRLKEVKDMKAPIIWPKHKVGTQTDETTT
jgi:hypothetical protein